MKTVKGDEIVTYAMNMYCGLTYEMTDVVTYTDNSESNPSCQNSKCCSVSNGVTNSLVDVNMSHLCVFFSFFCF